ncbi:MAG TPA: YceI family protein [Oligoflexia bacterium]|nr:YceI family protein [Oligoflexia bacterium]HMR25234.1 YceI family protein [Oligoflexia bacterium]
MKKIFLTLLSLALVPAAFAAKKVQTVAVDKDASTISWTGEKITGDTHVGTIAISEGSLEMKKNKLTGGSFVIDMSSIVNTDVEDTKYNKKLVDHLKSDDFFAAEKHPTAKFVITDVKAKKDGTHSITGDLTIRDKTKPISFDADVMQEDGVTVAKAEDVTFNRAEFDVKYNSGSFFSVKKLGDKLIKDEIVLDIVLKTQK